MYKRIKQAYVRFMLLLFFFITIVAHSSQAAQQFQGLCSYVKIEILQELALERVGFLATLTVTNNEGDASITNFSAMLTFEQPPLVAGDPATDASALFFVQPPEVKGVTSIDGTGILAPGQTAEVSWFIIPKVTAGGTDVNGVQYQVGANLAGSIYGGEIPQEVFQVLPDTITVKPDPQLDIIYFQPRDVDGDNPFTPAIVESPIPFTLGVLVRNVGHGRANKVVIESQQPRIVEDLQALLVIPQLLGARVDDNPTDSASLTLNLGDIEPGRCRKGAWDMITTLSGEFVEFNASYTHASELGGRDTSIIQSVNAYFMVHEVMNDQPGRDNLLDFLAETIDGPEVLIPDTLYESDCNVLPVNRLTDVTLIDYTHPVARVSANADFENWVFMRIDDPAQAKNKIASVVRSDGKLLNPNNYWTNIRYRPTDNQKLTYLNIFDFVSLGQYEYTVTYEPSGVDTVAPVTFLHFSGPVQENAGTFYVLPETQIFFIAEDESPVGIFYKLDGAVDFQPALPFTIPTEGTHTLEYYSVDNAQNQEAVQTATVVVSASEPGIENITIDSTEIFIAGDSLSVRPTTLSIGFNGVVTASELDAEVEVFRGAFGYPVLSGVPSTPTSNVDATITVGGENVDFYRYHLGNGVWSAEFPVSQPILLTGLNGLVQLSVSGRSQFGGYHPDTEAVNVSWTVDPLAPLLSITGVPPVPSRSTDATLNVLGSTDYCFRVDSSFYQPNTGAGSPIILSRLSDGEHSIEVIARNNALEACPGDVVGTASVGWRVDRQYGLNFPLETRVRHELLGPVDGNPTVFTWDGLDDSGVVAPPGWYTVKITVRDGLGRSTAAVTLVKVGDLVSNGTILADSGNAGQKEAHGFRDWVVWQDQRNSNWDIFVRDLSDPTAIANSITSNGLNNERPRTDGRYVVWESRQADGTWDVWAKELGTVGPVFAITTTPDIDEQRPVVYWPWVVYQTRPVSNPGAPWQLMAYNMNTGIEEIVAATTQNQLDPAIHKQQVVWQDFRDVGIGEIYLKDLASGVVKRITNDPGGQFHPVIFNQWIVWADNRNTQFDLYGHNLLRNAEIQLTNTIEDETRPYINGKWVVYGEDSAGELNINLRVLYLDNLATVQLTNLASVKEKPGIAANQLFWVDHRSGQSKVMVGSLPDLQPVFNNRNTVAVTEGMALNQRDAYTLLTLWNEQAGVAEITRYSTLLPQPVADTVTLTNGQPVGTNFTLEPGNFLWVKFDTTEILDLGMGGCGPLNLSLGVNVFSYSCYPDQYSAYQLIRELGVGAISSLRMLNSDTGMWEVVSVINNQIVGEDFNIPRIAVLMMEMNTALTSWKPGG